MEYIFRGFRELVEWHMDILLITIGRMKHCPEHFLVKKRFDSLSPLIGIRPIKIIEIDEKKFRTPETQAEKIREITRGKASVILFDEGGKNLSSKEFSKFLIRQRDEGVKQQIFVIGGAFGICSSLKKDADGLISLGKMVWPHFLARVMVAEQIYRAGSLMTGSPYHK